MESKPVSAERIDAIQKELLERMEREQAIRRKLTELLQSGTSMKEINAGHPLPKEMRVIDEANEAYLIATIVECGWPDAQRFGASAAQAAFLIVQHSWNQKLMSDALPQIEADARAKRVDAGQYALLYDRLHVRLHGKQRYGSQLKSNSEGELSLEPLEDPENVDKLRAELGMDPLADYLEHFVPQNGNKPVKIN